jgi:hypothetical protein
MLFRELIAVYCENHMEQINTLRGQNAEVRLKSASHFLPRHVFKECVKYGHTELLTLPHLFREFVPGTL